MKINFKCESRISLIYSLVYHLFKFLYHQVTSKKDQEQYWSNPDLPYRYIPVAKFAEAFRLFHSGKYLAEELDLPFDRRYNHPAALSTSKFGVRRRELFKTSFKWQVLLMKRNSFIYVFKFIQVIIFPPCTIFLMKTLNLYSLTKPTLSIFNFFFLVPIRNTKLFTLFI